MQMEAKASLLERERQRGKQNRKKKLYFFFSTVEYKKEKKLQHQLFVLHFKTFHTIFMMVKSYKS